MSAGSALAERQPDATATTVTAEQLDLIRRTVANGATPDELKLYLFDCQRQGVHPLDKLIHFTKRSGKYTPITSIDFMRIRAADSGEYAGSDDATFAALGVRENEPPLSATVTVYRLVQGQRCSFTATARWSEYKPESNDFMWRKMPHTMLAKCAEALALRKGFPRQLAGLYAKEEMDQADSAKPAYVVEAPSGNRSSVGHELNEDTSSRHEGNGAAQAAPKAPQVLESGSNPDGSHTKDNGPDLGADLPAGARLITKVEAGIAGSKARVYLSAPIGDANKADYLVFKDQLATLAADFCQNATPCFVELKKSASGNWRIESLMRVPDDYDPPAGKKATGNIDVSSIPF